MFNFMKTAAYLLILAILCACSSPEYKICGFETDDKELKLYHDVLSELVERHFYNRYLNQVITKELKEKYPGSTIEFEDTTEFKNDLILLQNKLFNDTIKFETICYGTLLAGPWKHGYSDSDDFVAMAKNDTTQGVREIKEFLTVFSSNWESVADTLAKPQTKYTSENFKLCTSKVISCEKFLQSDIGAVSFSKVFMNEDNTKGLLYYDFMCGGKCGKGEIILVEFHDQHWTIKKTIQLWIS